MIEGRDIIIYGGDWNWFPSVMERFAHQLAPKNRILWVGSVSIRRPRFHMYDVKRIGNRLREMFSTHDPHPNEKILSGKIHPGVIPFYDVPGVKTLNDGLLRKVIAKKMKELDFRNVISLPSTPMVADVIGTLGESSNHYFCLDDYTQYDGVYSCVTPLEKVILKKVDSSFALSEPLQKTRIAASGENHYLPMGVDYDMFNNCEKSIPSDLAEIKRPIAGFFGQIGSYVDIGLIVRCAKAYPDVSFVLMGRPHGHIDISPLTREKNIYFLGLIPYEKIAQYANAFDIALNPRVVNQLSLAMNPLKIVEYLSVGMPVVSTDLPAVRTFSNVVNIADHADHFVELIGTALKDTDISKRKERKSIAEQYSWKNIVERVSGIIERIDSGKHSFSKTTPS